MNKITVSAPGKLMLFGEHAVVYGHPCIVTAVDQRIFVSVSKLGSGNNVTLLLDIADEEIVFSLSDSRLIAEFPKEVRFVVAVLRRFYEANPWEGSLHVETRSDFSSLFGFGSSSAVTAATAFALNELFSAHFSKEKLFAISYQAVLDVQGVGSGFDLAAALWGGTLYFRPGGKAIEPLQLESLPLAVVYTGVKADTVTLVKQVAQLKKEKEKLVTGIFSDMEWIVEEARSALVVGDWDQVGKLMSANQDLLQKLGVSTPVIEKQLEVLCDSGVCGAKLSGAGGGDCVIGIGPVVKERLVELATKSGGTFMDVRVQAQGARVEG